MVEVIRIHAIHEEMAEPTIAFIGQRYPVDGLILSFGIIAFLAGAKRIDESYTVEFGDALHRGGVGGEILVFFDAVGQVLRGREILERDGRNEDEARGGRAVVGLAERVLHEGIELGFVEGKTSGPVEGFVEAEESEESIGPDLR